MFRNELIDHIATELKKRCDVDAEVQRPSEVYHLDIYLENIKIGYMFFVEDGMDEWYGEEEGLYFVGGELDRDFESIPQKINLNNVNFINNILELIESKRKYIESERNNRKPPNGIVIIHTRDFRE